MYSVKKNHHITYVTSSRHFKLKTCIISKVLAIGAHIIVHGNVGEEPNQFEDIDVEKIFGCASFECKTRS
jgi:hypothetical protein